MNDAPDITILLAVSLHLAGAGIAVQSLEILARPAELAPERLFGWRSAVNSGWRARAGSLANGWRGSLALLVARAVIAAVCVALPWRSPATVWCVGALLALQIGYNRRFTILAGNCETVFLVVLFALWSAALPEPTGRLKEISLLFVAAQTMLAYLVAGLHKAATAPWRGGARLRQIVQDGSYEMPRWLSRAMGVRGGARVASWLVILLELALPLAPFLPQAWFWPLLAAGFLFHTAIAVLMGLHGFWWAFAAAYPALVFAQGWWHGR